MEFHGKKYWQGRIAMMQARVDTAEQALASVRDAYAKAAEIIDMREQRITELVSQLNERESRIIELQDTLEAFKKLNALSPEEKRKAAEKAAQWDELLAYGGNAAEVTND